jgi:limonene 1,2-monooxygenase
MRFAVFLAPFHPPGQNPTLAIESDLALVQALDRLGYDEVWFGEHHSAGWELYPAPELMIAVAAERTKHIKLGTGVVSLPYHHPLNVAERMVFLDHVTRGRTLFGVGPGALPTDAFMRGIDPVNQRPMMEQALDAIVALLRSDGPVDRETDWFTIRDGHLQVKPYTRPHFEIGVAALFSPSGPTLAGRLGVSLLSLGATLLKGFDALGAHWDVYTETCAAHGHDANRETWRLLGPMHVAPTRDQARADVRYGLKRWLGYQQDVAILPFVPSELNDDELVDAVNDSGLAIIGTAADACAQIQRLWDQSGGFGTYMIMGTEWADPWATLRSYELIARFVFPEFQDSARMLDHSAQWATDNAELFSSRAGQAIQNAMAQYAETHESYARIAEQAGQSVKEFKEAATKGRGKA